VRRRAATLGTALACAALLWATGCPSDPFSADLELGGQVVAAAQLNHGHRVYRRYCISCHGPKGDGRGGAGGHMTPPPRDFTRGEFKFHSVDSGLPRDEDLLRTVRGGLRGTHMNGFQLAPADAEAVVQYLKTFSPRWRTERPGPALPIPPDPWQGRRDEAIARGRTVYHGAARCWQCHPSYLSAEALRAMAAANPEQAPLPPLRGDLAHSEPCSSAYGELLAPDFRDHVFRVGQRREALVGIIAAGVGGTPMPSWGRRLNDEDLWAVTHYVWEINRLRRAE